MKIFVALMLTVGFSDGSSGLATLGCSLQALVSNRENSAEVAISDLAFFMVKLPGVVGRRYIQSMIAIVGCDRNFELAKHY